MSALGVNDRYRWADPKFCQRRFAGAGRLGHGFKKLGLSHQLALPGLVNSPRHLDPHDARLSAVGPSTNIPITPANVRYRE